MSLMYTAAIYPFWHKFATCAFSMDILRKSQTCAKTGSLT